MINQFDDKQSEVEARIIKARRAKLLRRLVWPVVLLVLIVGGVYLAIVFTKRSSQNQPGVFYPEQGRDHVALGTKFEYNSNPPTSGPHFANSGEWGVYDKEIPDQVLIHNLEHGGIWIAYRPGADSAAVAELAKIAKEYGRKLIMAPRAANDADIALVAWTRLDKFSAAEFSEKRVRDFIAAYRNKGPEFVP